MSLLISFSNVLFSLLSFCGLLEDAQGPEVRSSDLRLAEVTCSGGFAGNYPCSNVDLLSHLPLSFFGSNAASDIWGWMDSSSGREFALLGLKDGTGMVEISDPANPVYLGKLPTHTVESYWRDIKVYNNHAFIVSEARGHGMQVFDLSQLLSLVSSWPVTLKETAFYDGVGNAHNIVINEATGFAYIVGVDGTNGCSGGLHMVNISNPISPIFAGCYGGDGYVHDAHCVVYKGPDSDHTDREICFCCNEDTVTVVDVTDKSNPVQLSRTSYSESSRSINTKTLVMNVQDLDNPFLAGSYSGRSKAIDHNLYVKDGFVFLSNYRAGLRVLYIDNLSTADFTEIGFFDIYPGSDSANFNGAWSVYPYFDSGTVVVSGMEQGLFVLRPDLDYTPVCSNCLMK
jgi:hypothetical protein